jgi:hypothetical protein
LAKQGGEGSTCIGQACFQATFVTLAALGLVATGCSAALYRRNRLLYRIEHRELHTYDREVSAPRE